MAARSLRYGPSAGGEAAQNRTGLPSSSLNIHTFRCDLTAFEGQ